MATISDESLKGEGRLKAERPCETVNDYSV